MAWQKQQAYDPTVAFLQNEREQKVLDLKIKSIDKLWFAQLKHLAKEKLEVTAELTKMEKYKRNLDHFDNNMDVHEIKPYSQEVFNQLRTLQREVSRDNFNFDEVKHRRESIAAAATSSIKSTPLPRLERQMGKCSLVSKKIKIKTHSKKHSKGRRKFKLKAGHLLSVSDSKLNVKTADVVKSAPDIGKPIEEAVNSNVNTKESFPQIQKRLQIVSNDEHRYLKHRMATALVLPPVSEIGVPKRKLSV